MDSSEKIIICGAGIAGLSTAYMLATKHGYEDILVIDERAPMSLTSDKSTECYRNWWPGPGDAMVKMMNRSIELIQEIAVESGNVFHLNRRGYLYCVTDRANIDHLIAFAKEASQLGAGELRIHRNLETDYKPAEPEGFENIASGADLFLDKSLIQKYFSYLSKETVAVLHVRNAGWLSAQQLGTYLLEQVKISGGSFKSGRIVEVLQKDGQVTGVTLASGEEIKGNVFINAAGPMLKDVGDLLGIDIPVTNELHLKASINDSHEAVDRTAPMVILAESQTLTWTDDEIEWLIEDEETKYLTESLPSGAHLRPEGGLDATSLLLLWDIHDKEVEAVFPPELDPMYPEMALRGISTLVPGLKNYIEKLPKPFIDGGYYTKTKENRPLACPLEVKGAYVIGAMAGYGIMAAAGLAEIVAASISENELPAYADAFSLDRYQDENYQNLLADWGDSWQL